MASPHGPLPRNSSLRFGSKGQKSDRRRRSGIVVTSLKRKDGRAVSYDSARACCADACPNPRRRCSLKPSPSYDPTNTPPAAFLRVTHLRSGAGILHLRTLLPPRARAHDIVAQDIIWMWNRHPEYLQIFPFLRDILTAGGIHGDVGRRTLDALDARVSARCTPHARARRWTALRILGGTSSPANLIAKIGRNRTGTPSIPPPPHLSSLRLHADATLMEKGLFYGMYSRSKIQGESAWSLLAILLRPPPRIKHRSRLARALLITSLPVAWLPGVGTHRVYTVYYPIPPYIALV
ncbi:hypothetical protein C8J57DRAFT_1501136 [Mycena rebaudengoi]|nr:hypothetical protein C8J57DRAFT_1501136 [Mycena rebaudengoi]